MRISDWSSDVSLPICELWARRTTTYRAITRRVSGIFTRYVPLWIKILAILPVIEDGSVLALCSLREKGMKWTMMAAAAISLAALTTPANAALRVLFTGTIDSSSPNPLAGEDGYQNIPLATDTLSVSFRISDSYLVDIGGGTSIAGVYHDPDGSMTIDAADRKSTRLNSSH